MILYTIKIFLLFLVVCILSFIQISSSAFGLSYQSGGYFECNKSITENVEYNETSTERKVNVNKSINKTISKDKIPLSIVNIYKGNIYIFEEYVSFSIHDYAYLIGIVKLTI